MADQSHVGASAPPVHMPVERGKIREFARATMSSHPAYVDDPAPVSPPTFLTTTNFWTTGASSPVARLGLDLKRILHGGQEYVFHGPPPRAGTELTLETTIDSITEKEGKRGGTMTFVVLRGTYRDSGGTLIAESLTTLIETGRAPTEEQ